MCHKDNLFPPFCSFNYEAVIFYFFLLSLLSSIVKKLEDKRRKTEKNKIQQHEIQDNNDVFDRVFAARGTSGLISNERESVTWPEFVVFGLPYAGEGGGGL